MHNTTMVAQLFSWPLYCTYVLCCAVLRCAGRCLVMQLWVRPT